MKPQNKIVVILLNILFCAVLLWFFTRNAFLRPYAGSPLKEVFAGLLLLGSLYANYFLLYPMLYQKCSHIIYWLLFVFIALVTGFIDLAIAYPNISVSCVSVIQSVGFFSFFSKRLLFIFGRNFAFNVFPFLFRERQHFQQALEKEVKVVYRDVRKLDVTDKDSNIHLVNIEEIFYCRQQRNFTNIYMVQNRKYTRLGSMKHLEQLFGEDFIRITKTELVPFRYIKESSGDRVTMKKMPWESEPTTFKLEPKNKNEFTKKIADGLQRNKVATNGKNISKRQVQRKVKRKQAIPSDEKLRMVFSYIEKHPNCNSVDIVAETKFSLSTVERCIFALKKQSLVKHIGSKMKGGYQVVNSTTENRDNV